LIRSLTTYQGFTVIERGEADLSGQVGFELADHIWRRPGNQNQIRSGKFLSRFRRQS
jgi:hypothetical protein